MWARFRVCVSRVGRGGLWGFARSPGRGVGGGVRRQPVRAALVASGPVRCVAAGVAGRWVFAALGAESFVRCGAGEFFAQAGIVEGGGSFLRVRGTQDAAEQGDRFAGAVGDAVAGPQPVGDRWLRSRGSSRVVLGRPGGGTRPPRSTDGTRVGRCRVPSRLRRAPSLASSARAPRAPDRCPKGAAGGNHFLREVFPSGTLAGGVSRNRWRAGQLGCRAAPRPMPSREARSPTRQLAMRSGGCAAGRRTTSVATPSRRSASSARCTCRSESPVRATRRALEGRRSRPV